MRIVLAVLALGVLAHGVRSVTGARYDTLFNDWIYHVLMWAGVALCAARCLVAGGERLAWGVMAASMGFWAAGDLAWTVHCNHVDEPPFPNVADFLYLACIR